MSIFKAYDIRGKYPDEIDEDLACRIGFEYARMLGADELCVCQDVRTSSPAVAEAVIDGICRAGTNVYDAGQGTTPMSNYAVGHYELDGAIMVTASHNPPEYTGMKLAREKAIPVSGDTGIQELAERCRRANGSKPSESPTGSVEELDLIPVYREHLQSFCKNDPSGVSVAADGATGAVAAVFDDVAGDIGVDWTTLCMEPDGTFPNHPPNPLKEENTRDLVEELNSGSYDLGVAFDGDGDRAIFMDDQANRVSADLITAVLADQFLQESPGEAVVYDLRSSRVVPETIREHDGTPIRERVGHAFIKATMREEDAIFGGELSGHYYFRDHYYADSGLVAAITLIDCIARTGMSLSDLVEPFRTYRQSGEINFEVDDKDGCIEHLSETFSDHEQYRLDGLTVESEDWWFNVRKSNTEPLLRLNLEANNQKLLGKKVEQVRGIIKSYA
jgi:phosphomannomutase